MLLSSVIPIFSILLSFHFFQTSAFTNTAQFSASKRSSPSQCSGPVLAADADGYTEGSSSSDRRRTPRAPTSRGSSSRSRGRGSGGRGGGGYRGGRGRGRGRGGFKENPPGRWWLNDVDRYNLDVLGEYEPWWADNEKKITKELKDLPFDKQKFELEERGISFEGLSDNEIEKKIARMLQIYSMGDEGFQEANVYSDTDGIKLPPCYPETYEDELFMENECAS
mmetsp:Transcript_45107/g.65942  ORF Transcript_45107/g.65942 Transcript_45107/m.65942 type:complete len:223 (+) Transcript_45107:101-769(+)